MVRNRTCSVYRQAVKIHHAFPIAYISNGVSNRIRTYAPFRMDLQSTAFNRSAILTLLVEGAGFEPARDIPDLQSGAIGLSANLPYLVWVIGFEPMRLSDRFYRPLLSTTQSYSHILFGVRCWIRTSAWDAWFTVRCIRPLCQPSIIIWCGM